MHKTLIIYDSPFGSTKGVAQAIADAIGHADTAITILPVADAPDSLVAYNAVIIGAPIRYDRWTPAIIGFVTRHQTHLATLPVAYFFTCLTLSQNSVKAVEQAARYGDAIIRNFPQIAPTSVGQFAGVLNFRKFPTVLRPVMRLLFAILPVKQGDYRNWPEIRAWAKNLMPSLTRSS